MVFPADPGRVQERISRIEVGLVSLPSRPAGEKSVPGGQLRNIAAPVPPDETTRSSTAAPAGEKKERSPAAAENPAERRADPPRLESPSGTVLKEEPPPTRAPPSLERQPQTEFPVPAETSSGPLLTSADSGSPTEPEFAGFFEKREASASVPLIEARPRYDHNAPPPYPRLARERGWEGEVLLRVLVSEAGAVRRVSIERSSGHAVLDAAALKAVRRWRFHPSRLGAAPVEGEVLVPLRFKLRDI